MNTLGAGQGLAVPTKVIKQADVIMMLNMFKRPLFNRNQEGPNWEYYEPRTETRFQVLVLAHMQWFAADIGKTGLGIQLFFKDGEN